jgi:hypothetical protein
MNNASEAPDRNGQASFCRRANAVPRMQEKAKFLKKTDGGITQTLAALATLATLAFLECEL